MIDIVNFSGDLFQLGFSKIYNVNDFNIKLGKNNREIASDKNIDILLMPEIASKGRNLVNLDSGLNEVICRLASKNEVAMGISFSAILNSKNRSWLLARLMQNVRLCRKYKVKMVMASFASDKYEMRHARDLLNFCLVLGMNDKEAGEALNFKKKEMLPRFV